MSDTWTPSEHQFVRKHTTYAMQDTSTCLSSTVAVGKKGHLRTCVPGFHTADRHTPQPLPAETTIHVGVDEEYSYSAPQLCALQPRREEKETGKRKLRAMRPCHALLLRGASSDHPRAACLLAAAAHACTRCAYPPACPLPRHSPEPRVRQWAVAE